MDFIAIVFMVVVVLELGWIRMRIDKTNELLAKNKEEK
jgi:hypothetical protein